MRNLEVKTLRVIPMERIRHEMRRAAARAERARVDALRGLWSDYGRDGERLA